MFWRDKPCIMGIVNVTPDSFSGDGRSQDEAIAQASRMIWEGADILDIGGESTRPDASPVPAAEEIKRIVPVIETVRGNHPETIISVDTMKVKVAQAAIAAGASWINDVTGGQGDPAMLTLSAEQDVPIVLMHNRAFWGAASGPKNARSYDAPEYDSFMDDMMHDLELLKKRAVRAGVAEQNIILDPGIGFGKTPQQNCQIIRDLKRFNELGCSILIGPSRKSFIGRTLGGLSAEERLEGTAAAVAIAIDNGADIVRVHDVKEMRRVVDMAHAIKVS